MEKTTKHPLTVWREAQNPPVTQADFARQISVSRWTMTSIETGRRRAGRDLAATIIKATGGSLSFEGLMAWEPAPEPTEVAA